MAAVPSFRLVFERSKLTGRGGLSTCVRPIEASVTGPRLQSQQVTLIQGGVGICAVATLLHRREPMRRKLLVSGIAGAGLSGAAAIASGALAKRLAAGAGFSQAARSEINLDIYRQALIEAVFKAIDNERQRQEQLIQPKRTTNLAVYSIDDS